MKVSYKRAVEIYDDLNLASIAKKTGVKLTQDQLLGMAELILKDQNIYLNDEPTEKVRKFAFR